MFVRLHGGFLNRDWRTQAVQRYHEDQFYKTGLVVFLYQSLPANGHLGPQQRTECEHKIILLLLDCHDYGGLILITTEADEHRSPQKP